MKKRTHSIFAPDYMISAEADHRTELFMIQKAAIAATRITFDLERRDNIFYEASDSFLKLIRTRLKTGAPIVDAPDTYAITHSIPEASRIIYKHGNRRKAGNYVEFQFRPIDTANFHVESVTAREVDGKYLVVLGVQKYHYTFEMPESDVIITATIAENAAPLSDCYWGANQSGIVLDITTGEIATVDPERYTTIPFSTIGNPAYLWIAFREDDQINYQKASFGGDYPITDTFEDFGLRNVEGIQYRLWIHKWKTEMDFLNFIHKEN